MSQYDDYMRDLHAVADGSKPAVIVERRKSAKAYMQAMSVAIRNGLTTHQQTLADSTGKRLPAIMVARDSRVLTRIVKLLHGRKHCDREQFQVAMGLLLGYSVEDCYSYVDSRLSLTCGCQLCGGPTPQSRHDDACEARRTQFHV